MEVLRSVQQVATAAAAHLGVRTTPGQGGEDGAAAPPEPDPVLCRVVERCGNGDLAVLLGLQNGFQLGYVTPFGPADAATRDMVRVAEWGDGRPVAAACLLRTARAGGNGDAPASGADLASSFVLLLLGGRQVVLVFSVAVGRLVHVIRNFSGPVRSVRSASGRFALGLSAQVQIYDAEAPYSHIFSVPCWPEAEGGAPPFAIGARWLAYPSAVPSARVAPLERAPVRRPGDMHRGDGGGSGGGVGIGARRSPLSMPPPPDPPAATAAGTGRVLPSGAAVTELAAGLYTMAWRGGAAAAAWVTVDSAVSRTDADEAEAERAWRARMQLPPLSPRSVGQQVDSRPGPDRESAGARGGGRDGGDRGDGGGMGTVAVVDMADGSVVAAFCAFPGSPLALLEFDPTGARLAAASREGQTVHVYELVTLPGPAVRLRSRLVRWMTHAYLDAARFSGDGRWLAVLERDGPVHLFGPLEPGLAGVTCTLPVERPDALRGGAAVPPAAAAAAIAVGGGMRGGVAATVALATPTGRVEFYHVATSPPPATAAGGGGSGAAGAVGAAIGAVAAVVSREFGGAGAAFEALLVRAWAAVPAASPLVRHVDVAEGRHDRAAAAGPWAGAAPRAVAEAAREMVSCGLQMDGAADGSRRLVEGYVRADGGAPCRDGDDAPAARARNVLGGRAALVRSPSYHLGTWRKLVCALEPYPSHGFGPVPLWRVPQLFLGTYRNLHSDLGGGVGAAVPAGPPARASFSSASASAASGLLWSTGRCAVEVVAGMVRSAEVPQPSAVSAAVADATRVPLCSDVRDDDALRVVVDNERLGGGGGGLAALSIADYFGAPPPQRDVHRPHDSGEPLQHALHLSDWESDPDEH